MTHHLRCRVEELNRQLTTERTGRMLHLAQQNRSLDEKTAEMSRLRTQLIALQSRVQNLDREMAQLKYDNSMLAAQNVGLREDINYLAEEKLKLDAFQLIAVD